MTLASGSAEGNVISFGCYDSTNTVSVTTADATYTFTVGDTLTLVWNGSVWLVFENTGVVVS